MKYFNIYHPRLPSSSPTSSSTVPLPTSWKKKKKSCCQVMVVHIFNPSTWKAETGGSEFNPSLVYRESSRTAKAHRDTKQEQKPNEQKKLKKPKPNQTTKNKQTNKTPQLFSPWNTLPCRSFILTIPAFKFPKVNAWEIRESLPSQPITKSCPLTLREPSSLSPLKLQATWSTVSPWSFVWKYY